ncbi:DUF6502 family protein [Roseomonas sp. E05]|uniref:DUF6502 family protein n=1 Tax=Roseomonas sp. E05 TaxID=3046310 RepID=UPI0024B9AA72|nr:DUF6502 family protein [Roseomonas sp. E05]MDJ0388528.1 DUF6502 family protein [Roseomonas sp. E05]
MLRSASPSLVPVPVSPPDPQALLRPLARALEPLVDLLIRSGVPFPAFTDLLRKLYMRRAAHIVAGRKPLTDSRLALVTGVHRKEIRRMREEGGETEEVPVVVSLSSQILARWTGLAPYADAEGRPRPLPRNAPEGVPSFESLVASVTADLRPRTVLDDWLSQGRVAMNNEDHVVLRETAFLPSGGSGEQLYYFSRNLHDHIAAASANITAGAPPFLDRGLHYDRLPLAIAARLEAEAREAAQAMLLALNRRALELLEAEDAKPAPSSTRRVHLGIYLFSENEPQGGAP